MEKLLRFNNQRYFWLLCAFSLLFAFLGNHFLFTDSLYYSTLNEQYTNEQIRAIINIRNKWSIISYFLIPLFIIIRILYTSFCLFLGDLFLESHWGFKRMFNVALKADTIFVLSAIIVFYYFLIFGEYQTNVNPFSLLAVIGQGNVPKWLYFAYNSLNVFELIYLVFLTLLIRSSTQIGYIKAFIFSVLTYEIGNYLYVISITFIYLNFS